jgi:chemotaxis protein CheX
MHVIVPKPPIAIEVPAPLAECVWQAIHEFCTTALAVVPVVQVVEGSEAPCDGVIGVISFLGDLDWSLSLGFPRETAVALSAKFAGFEIEFDSADMGDVIGEMANVVAGDVVARLADCGIQVQMSMPTVTRGHEMEVLSSSRQKCCGRLFITPDGLFWAHVTVFTAPRDRGAPRTV